MWFTGEKIQEKNLSVKTLMEGIEENLPFLYKNDLKFSRNNSKSVQNDSKSIQNDVKSIQNDLKYVNYLIYFLKKVKNY